MAHLFEKGIAMKKTHLAFLLFLIAFLVLLHQALTWQVWFELKDVHHETFAVGLVCLGIGILIGKKK
jgi:hypothetical protein